MDVRCAWCGASLPSTSAALPEADGLVSHGICDSCADAVVNEQGIPVQQFLATLDAPAVLVTDDMEVLAVNQSGETFLRKDVPAILGRFGGEVFECVNSGLPGGCGRTIHCSGCALRQAIEDTHASGVAAFRVPASLRVNARTQPEEVDLFITTAKVGDRVLVRIDPAHDDG